MFSPSKYGLGHFHHCNILNQKINERGHDDMASLHLTDLLPSDQVPYNTLKIPNHSELLMHNGINIEGDIVNIDKYQLTSIRKHMISLFLDVWSPKVVVIDYYPFIHSDRIFNEFHECIEHWKNQSKNRRLIALYRGILGFNSKNNPPSYKKRIENTIANQIDLILVNADLDERFFLREELWFLRDYFSKFKYVGYITDIGNSFHNQNKKIVCQAGGGIDGEKLVKTLCDSMLIINQFDQDVKAIIFLGPTFPPKKKKEIIARYSKFDCIEFSDGVSDLTSYIEGANLIISMGGYNSVVEAANIDRPSIIIPREKEEKHEQYLNALRFYQYGLIDEVIEMELLREKTIIPAIIRQLYKKNIKPVDMRGLEKSIDEIQKSTHSTY